MLRTVRRRPAVPVTLSFALVLGLPLLAGLNPYVVSVAAEFLIFAIVALSLDLLMGHSGQISLGHSGFFAVGAYATAILNASYRADLGLALPVAAALAALSSLAVGFPAERLRGHYLGIVTLGFGIAVAQVALKWTALTNGDEGVRLEAIRFFGLHVDAGDLAREDDGVVYLEGRAREVISRAGNKVSPLEIEAAFADHPAVASVLATGVADALTGERIHVLVVPRAGAIPDEIELRRWGAERLEKFKRPDVIHFGGELPLGPTGKADRGALRRLLADATR